MLKENKGITLVALVITIIVLLILAGVSIAMIGGENGILTKATDARDDNEKADVNTALGMAINEFMTKYYGGDYAATDIDTEQEVADLLEALAAKYMTGTTFTITDGSAVGVSGITGCEAVIDIDLTGTAPKMELTAWS